MNNTLSAFVSYTLAALSVVSRFYSETVTIINKEGDENNE